jgi:hypothetical protein
MASRGAFPRGKVAMFGVIYSCSVEFDTGE